MVKITKGTLRISGSLYGSNYRAGRREFDFTDSDMTNVVIDSDIMRFILQVLAASHRTDSVNQILTEITGKKYDTDWRKCK